MTGFLSEDERRTLEAALDRVIPAAADDDHPMPGALAAGVADYVDGLLGAFSSDPPRIWAGGPFSGRHGGEASFDQWFELDELDELAWRTRIEGSLGILERELNGPVVGLQQRYRDGLRELGIDFADVDVTTRDERLAAAPGFAALLYEHACEGLYGDPVYGGNRAGVGWRSIEFPGDVQPRGYTDDEVRGRD